MHFIEALELTKTYSIKPMKTDVGGAVKSLFEREKQTITALDGISFHIDEHELIGYIGPNGAGKSTTMKILSGILVPDSGQITVKGKTPYKQRKEHVKDIGVVFGQRTQLWWDVPVIESYKLLGDIYRVERKAHRKIMDELTAVLDAQDLLHMPLRKLSLGQRMRCELIGALLHTPKMLFLDEPTIGLDAVSKIRLRQFISDRNKEQGTTVILTTHDMDDIEQLCSRVMVIGRGRILFDGSIRTLREKYAPFKFITVHTHNCVPKPLPEAKIVKSDTNSVTYEYSPAAISTAEMITRLNGIYDVHDLTVENPDIENVVSKMYEGEGI